MNRSIAEAGRAEAAAQKLGRDVGPARRRSGGRRSGSSVDQQPAVETVEQISAFGAGIAANRSMNAELRSYPLPATRTGTSSPACARRGRTTVRSAASSARRWSRSRGARGRIIARPLMPPTFRLSGSRNQVEAHREDRAAEGISLHPICQMVLHVSRFKPSSSLLCSVRVLSFPASDIQLHLRLRR